MGLSVHPFLSIHNARIYRTAGQIGMKFGMNSVVLVYYTNRILNSHILSISLSFLSLHNHYNVENCWTDWNKI